MHPDVEDGIKASSMVSFPSIFILNRSPEPQTLLQVAGFGSTMSSNARPVVDLQYGYARA